MKKELTMIRKALLEVVENNCLSSIVTGWINTEKDQKETIKDINKVIRELKEDVKNIKLRGGRA